MITFYVRCSRKIRKSSEASEIDPVLLSKIIGVAAIILDDQTDVSSKRQLYRMTKPDVSDNCFDGPTSTSALLVYAQIRLLAEFKFKNCNVSIKLA